MLPMYGLKFSMNSQRIIKNSIKRGLISLVALLFVVYALADITVLQAYCGNEAVGIPPAHHLSKTARDPDSRSATKSIQTRLQSDGEPRQGNDPTQDCDDDTCFCCCSHVVTGYFAIPSTKPTNKIEFSQSDTYVGRYSNSSLTQLFRPPRTA